MRGIEWLSSFLCETVGETIKHQHGWDETERYTFFTIVLSLKPQIGLPFWYFLLKWPDHSPEIGFPASWQLNSSITLQETKWCPEWPHSKVLPMHDSCLNGGSCVCLVCNSSQSWQSKQIAKEFPNTKYCRKEWVYFKEQRAEITLGTVSIAGWPPDRPGKVNVFLGLGANFYSLKTKKIPVGRVALGDWLEHSRVSTGMGIFV